jgi:hypothetical protein
MKFPIGAMAVGDILDRGLKLLFARFPLLITINLLVMIPLIVLQLALPALEGSVGAALALLGIYLLSIAILSPIAQAVVLYVVTQEYIDRPATLGQAFSVAFRRFGSLLGTVVLAGLFIALGSIMCFFPALYFMTIYAFVAQVVVLEDRSGMDALNRSKQLVSGFGWRVFGVLLLIGIVSALLSGMVGKGLELILPFQETVPGPGPFPIVVGFNYRNYAINNLGEDVVTVVLSAYQAVCLTLLYLDLRIRKEGLDLEIEAQKGAYPKAEPLS